ncbi:MBL fold metallo-hydrolase [Chloroflexota bacterium]
MILKRLVVGPFASNCYIVGSESTMEGFIIDPGEEANAIINSIKDLKLDIKTIVLTHSHIDHISALGEVKEATGAEIAVHTDDARALLSGEGRSVSAMFGIAYKTPPAPDRLLNDGDNIDIVDLHFTVIHTPGHTPGGICLLGHDVVFTGDTLFNCGIGRTDLPGGSYQELMNSINSKLMQLPENTTVYPGHGPETTIATESRSNPFLHGM